MIIPEIISFFLFIPSTHYYLHIIQSLRMIIFNCIHENPVLLLEIIAAIEKEYIQGSHYYLIIVQEFTIEYTALISSQTYQHTY